MNKRETEHMNSLWLFGRVKVDNVVALVSHSKEGVFTRVKERESQWL